MRVSLSRKEERQRDIKPPGFFQETANLIDDGPPVHLTVRLVRSISRRYRYTYIQTLYIYYPRLCVCACACTYKRIIFIRFYFCRPKLLMHARKGSTERSIMWCALHQAAGIPAKPIARSVHNKYEFCLTVFGVHVQCPSYRRTSLTRDRGFTGLGL